MSPEAAHKLLQSVQSLLAQLPAQPPAAAPPPAAPRPPPPAARPAVGPRVHGFFRGAPPPAAAAGGHAGGAPYGGPGVTLAGD